MPRFWKANQPQPTYSPIELESGEELTSSVSCIPWYQTSEISRRVWMIHAVLFLVSITAGFIVSTRTSNCPLPSPSYLGKHPFEIPIYENTTHTETVRFIGNPNAKSPFKGPPTAEVDAAWDSLWASNVVLSYNEYMISEPEYPQMGVKALNKGTHTYFATFEATHQLHCLYTLFRASYVDYYEPEKNFMAKNPDRYHARLDHCTDMLRQKLMCNADAGIVTYNWVKGEDTPVANYNVMHQCRKYDVLMKWSLKHAATGAVFQKTGSELELDQDP